MPQSHVIEALKNQDILSLIFQHFDLQPGSQTVAQTRKDLFSAAKTCKAFVEPALDSLWRVLPSLLPLLLLLPSAEVNNGHFVCSISSCQYRVRYLLASIFFDDEVHVSYRTQDLRCSRKHNPTKENDTRHTPS